MMDARKTISEVVVVSAGSFNPPTVAHQWMWRRAARHAATLPVSAFGSDVVASECPLPVTVLVSPVNDAYNKPGLAPAVDRLRLCREAAAAAAAPFSSSLLSGSSTASSSPARPETLDLLDALPINSSIFVDPWEAEQPKAVRTLDLLLRVQSVRPNAAVMLLCGSDMARTMTVGHIWMPEQVSALLESFSLLLMPRGSEDLKATVRAFQASPWTAPFADRLLAAVMPVDPSHACLESVSSTGVRLWAAEGFPRDEREAWSCKEIRLYLKTTRLYCNAAPLRNWGDTDSQKGASADWGSQQEAPDSC
jgi:nicotinamide mononucleotide adenylyltransferase